MNVVDLHPEELIDKEARNALTESEKARLDSHVMRCAACRFEREARADFASELDADLALNVTGLVDAEEVRLAREAIERIEKKLQAPPAASEESEEAVERLALVGASRASKRRRRMMAAWALVAAAVLLVGVAGAREMGVRAWHRIVRVLDPSVTSLATTTAKHEEEHHAAPRLPAPVVEAAPPPEAPNLVPVEAPAPVVAPVRVAPAPKPARVALPEPTAAAMFDEASDARKHGDYARALTLGRSLENRYAASPEAQVTRATIGRMLLDRGDPAGALASFDAYSTHGSGDLAEEVAIGRALALDRLGRDGEAVRAWSGLLAAFPSTPYAAHAKARLARASAP